MFKQTTIRLESNLLKKIRILAVEQNSSVSRIVSDLLKSYIKDV